MPVGHPNNRQSQLLMWISLSISRGAQTPLLPCKECESWVYKECVNSWVCKEWVNAEFVNSWVYKECEFWVCMQCVNSWVCRVGESWVCKDWVKSPVNVNYWQGPVNARDLWRFAKSSSRCQAFFWSRYKCLWLIVQCVIKTGKCSFLYPND